MGNWAQRQRRGAAVATLSLPAFTGEFDIDDPSADLCSFDLITPNDPEIKWQVRARVISNGTWAQSDVNGSGDTNYLVEIPGYAEGAPCEAEARLLNLSDEPTTLFGGRITFTMGPPT